MSTPPRTAPIAPAAPRAASPAGTRRRPRTIVFQPGNIWRTGLVVLGVIALAVVVTSVLRAALSSLGCRPQDAETGAYGTETPWLSCRGNEIRRVVFVQGGETW